MQEWLVNVIAGGIVTVIWLIIVTMTMYHSFSKRSINRVYRIHLKDGGFFDVVLIANGILISPKLMPSLLGISIVDKQTGEVFGQQKTPVL